MATVSLENITKVYDDSQGTEVAVQELDAEFEDGEFVVVLGPSGCGKSTTLRMLAGLEDVSQGEILIDDDRVTDKKPKDRDIALVFQNYALYPHKSVRENMGYGLRMRSDLSDEEVDEQVRSTAEMMGIDDLLEKSPSALSGGQKQRVATGRAIVREPALFLFDEPLSNLDAKLRKHLRTELARLHSQLGITSVYVTHNQEEAMTLGDKVLVLDDGRLQQADTPLEIYHNPANLFVADFIGSPSMNFFDVTLQTGQRGGTLVADDFEYDLSESLVSSIDRGVVDEPTEEFVLGIRPENIRLGEDAPEGKTFRGTVDVVETMGADNFLYLDITDRECMVRVSPDVNPSPGTEMAFTFDESDLVLFDRQSEVNVLQASEAATVEQEQSARTPDAQSNA